MKVGVSNPSPLPKFPYINVFSFLVSSMLKFQVFFIMRKRNIMKCLFIIASSLFFGCTNNSGGSSAIFGVVVVSNIAQGIADGDRKTVSLWCETLRSVSQSLNLQEEQDFSSIYEKVSEPVLNVSRTNGFRLHEIQIRNLIQDAYAVARDVDAGPKAQKACAGKI